MSKYKHGEHISLWFEDYELKEYVKGWVNEQEAQTALDQAFDDEKQVVSIEHTYAFWGRAIDDCGEPCGRFYLRSETGRGRFKVTEVCIKEAA